MNIHDVYLYALSPGAPILPSTCLGMGLASILAFHSCRYDALHVEELLVLLTVSVVAGLPLGTLLIVGTRISQIRLLLDILRRMRPAVATRTATPTRRLRGSRVLSGDELLLGMVESSLVLIHVGPMGRIDRFLACSGSSRHCAANVDRMAATCSLGASSRVSVLNERLLSVAAALLDPAFKLVTMHDVFDLVGASMMALRLVGLTAHAHSTNVTNVTVLVGSPFLNQVSLLWIIVMLLLERLLDELVFEDAALGHACAVSGERDVLGLLCVVDERVRGLHIVLGCCSMAPLLFKKLKTEQ